LSEPTLDGFASPDDLSHVGPIQYRQMMPHRGFPWLQSSAECWRPGSDSISTDSIEH
jgi:hypothetical protein